MDEKRTDRVLKLIYFFIGIKMAVFAFIISLLIDLEYKAINMILSISLAALLFGIFILIFFVLSLIFKPELLEKKIARQLIGFVGAMIGLVFGSMLVWVLLYRGS